MQRLTQCSSIARGACVAGHAACERMWRDMCMRCVHVVCACGAGILARPTDGAGPFGGKESIGRL